jgi:predicted ATP-dependent serine protease
MIRRDGEVCAVCGYPTAPWHRLCQQCQDWQPIAEAAEAAIEDARAETERRAA